MTKNNTNNNKNNNIITGLFKQLFKLMYEVKDTETMAMCQEFSCVICRSIGTTENYGNNSKIL